MEVERDIQSLEFAHRDPHQELLQSTCRGSDLAKHDGLAQASFPVPIFVGQNDSLDAP